MGELLQLYLGKDHKSPSRAFWLGASRVIDLRPVISASVVTSALAIQEEAVVDDWATVGEELHEAIATAEAHGKTGSK